MLIKQGQIPPGLLDTKSLAKYNNIMGHTTAGVEQPSITSIMVDKQEIPVPTGGPGSDEEEEEDEFKASSALSQKVGDTSVLSSAAGQPLQSQAAKVIQEGYEEQMVKYEAQIRNHISVE
jgi:hypothetical protein